MIDSMKKVLAGESPQQKGKKPIKPNDLVRLYENILQNLKDMPHLAGLEDDLEFHHETEAKVTFYKATRYLLDLSMYFPSMQVLVNVYCNYFFSYSTGAIISHSPLWPPKNGQRAWLFSNEWFYMQTRQKTTNY